MWVVWFKSLTHYCWEKSTEHSMETEWTGHKSQSEGGGKLRNPRDVSTALTVKYHLPVCDALYIGGSLPTVWRNTLLPFSHGTVSWAEWIDMYHIFPHVYTSTLKMDAACSADVSVMIYQTMQVGHMPDDSNHQRNPCLCWGLNSSLPGCEQSLYWLAHLKCLTLTQKFFSQIIIYTIWNQNY
jgi:hypothetical protein